MKEILQQVYWQNSIQDYLVALGSILLAWLIVKLIKNRVIHFLKKITSGTDSTFDDVLVHGIEKFAVPYFYFLVNYNILTHLTLSSRFSRILDVAIALISVWYIVRCINYVMHNLVVLYMQKKGEAPERIKQLNGILIVVKGVIWSMGIIMLIDNLGYDITTIIAGLGVGGIAIALAAQNILGDLFSYLVIFFDKPFETGDFIVVGGNAGIVERIGIKTTHVRSLDGQQLVMPNAEMVKSVINNFKRLQRRRVILNLRLHYQTPLEKLSKVTGWIKEIIDSNTTATFDRGHFKAFGDFSLEYEIVYYVESANYLDFMNVQQEVGFKIFSVFEKEAIRFAIPAQNLFLQGNIGINRNKEEVAA